METQDPLVKSLEALTKQMKNSNSLWQSFRRGVVIGIGSAIGASTLAAIVIGILAKIFHSFQGVFDFLGKS